MKNKKVMVLFSALVLILYLTFGILGLPTASEMKDFGAIKLGYYIIGGLFILILSYVYSKDLMTDETNFIKKFKYNIIEIIKYTGLILIGYALIKLIFINLFQSDNNITQSSSYVINTFKYFPFYIIFVILIYTPYVEEIIFRKSIYHIIKNKFLYVIISSLLFGLLHVIGDGNATSIGSFFLLLIPYTYFGVILALSYLKTKNIFIPIMCHLLYSSILILLLFGM